MASIMKGLVYQNKNKELNVSYFFLQIRIGLRCTAKSATKLLGRGGEDVVHFLFGGIKVHETSWIGILSGSIC